MWTSNNRKGAYSQEKRVIGRKRVESSEKCQQEKSGIAIESEEVVRSK